MTEFNLSEKKRRLCNHLGVPEGEWLFYEDDVKEFIRLLRLDILTNECRCDDCIKSTIDKFAGVKLI